MKKIISFVMCLLAISSTISASSSTTVLLQHGENVTHFNADKIGDAFEAANDGDVIYLNEGTYPAFNITKKVYVKGVGSLTIINGDINIAIPNEPTLEEPILEYLNVSGLVSITKSTKGLRLKQCRIESVSFDAITEDAYIDRCNLYANANRNNRSLVIDKTYKTTITVDDETTTYEYPYVKKLTVTNSYVKGPADNSICPNTSYINCNIDTRSANGYGDINLDGGYYINCILVCYYVNNISEIRDATLINSYYQGNPAFYNCKKSNCYNGNDFLWSSSAEALKNQNYIGNDGTVIGICGGNTPYTLVPSVPKVTESSLKVDTKKQELNVTLSVSPK